ncbi:MAG: ABC transporter permease subunit, partial [Planctomycetota bacterium]
MRSLEDTLSPSGRPAHSLRDVMVLAPVVVLTLTLLPSWSSPDVYVTDVAAQVASPHLLTALGMLLALRVGVIDLSVWMVAAAGTLLTAGLMAVGVSPVVGFGLAGLAGAACGAINALCVCRLRLPGPVATLLVALAVLGVCWWACPAARVDIPEGAFDGWLLSRPAASDIESDEAAGTDIALPLILTRTVLVAGVYAAAMFGLLPWRSGIGRSRWRRAATLIAAGFLAGLAGAIRTMDLDAAALSARPIGDLRIAAAVLLAGGCLLAGPARTLITAAVLPIALLAATMWRQQVWTLGVWGIEWQVVLLIAL